MAQLKSDFVANVSHDLKTPLSVIRMFGETLEMGRVPDEARRQEYYRVITRESERLSRLIDNVLDFSRIEGGRRRYDLAPTAVEPLIRDTLEAFAYPLEQGGFKLEVAVAADLPEVPMDADAISQALANLIDNAIKYSDADRVVAVDARRDGEGLALTVADRGVGIAPAEHTRIFEKFYRVGRSETQGRRGSGVGLALVRHVAEAHRRPRDRAERARPGQPLHAVAAPRSGRRRVPRILIVDDEPEIVRGLEDNLRFEGYETLSATSGEEGLARALGEAPDLVLLDIMMPRLSGWDVCRELRRRGVDVPVIMLTARGEEVDRVRGLELGADDYVAKPFSLRELLARVRAVLRRPGPRQKFEELAFGERARAPARPARDPSRPRDAHDAQGVRPARVPGRAPGRRHHARATARRGVGLRAVSDDAHRGHARAASASQARGRSRPAGLHPDRARTGLPIRHLMRC